MTVKITLHMLETDPAAWCPFCSKGTAVAVTSALESSTPSDFYPVVYTIARCGECRRELTAADIGAAS